MTNYFEKPYSDAVASFLSSKDTSDSDNISIVYAELAKQKDLNQILKTENRQLINDNQHLKSVNQRLTQQQNHSNVLEFDLLTATNDKRILTARINELEQDNYNKDIQIQHQRQLISENQKHLIQKDNQINDINEISTLANRFQIAPGNIHFIDEDQYITSSCIYIFYGLNSHLLKVGRTKNLKQRVNLYKLTANTKDTYFDPTEEVLLWRLIEYPAGILNAIEAVYRGGLTYLFGTADYGHEWWKISDERESVIEKYVILIQQSDILKRILSQPTDWLNSLYVASKVKNAITSELIQKRKTGLING